MAEEKDLTATVGVPEDYPFVAEQTKHVDVPTGWLVFLPLIALAISIVAQLIIMAKTWGRYKEVVESNRKDIAGLKKDLRKEDGTPNFVFRHEHERRGERCPAVICARIDEVKELVEVSAARMNQTRERESEMGVYIKTFEKVLDKQQNVIDRLEKNTTALQTQMGMLQNLVKDVLHK
jgi:hypothetical protein